VGERKTKGFVESPVVPAELVPVIPFKKSDSEDRFVVLRTSVLESDVVVGGVVLV
jgi:hypothetical protein